MPVKRCQSGIASQVLPGLLGIDLYVCGFESFERGRLRRFLEHRIIQIQSQKLGKSMLRFGVRFADFHERPKVGNRIALKPNEVGGECSYKLDALDAAARQTERLQAFEVCYWGGVFDRVA